MTPEEITPAAQEEPIGEEHADLAGKYLSFFLEGQEFGISITKVREILGIMEITPVPQTANYVLGVINLRGKVIPVIDLRLRFDLEFRESDHRTAVIVVETEGEEGSTQLLSIVVDQVNEVLNVEAEQVGPAPQFGQGVDASFLLGLAKAESGVKILLDIDKVVSESRLSLG